MVFRFYLEIQRLRLPLQARPAGTEVETLGQGRKPDVCVITNTQAQDIDNSTAILTSPPPLVVEVVSPESVNRDYDRKLNEYEAIGIPEYWIADPISRQVTICLLISDRYQQTTFTGDEWLVSRTFSELVLIVDYVLGGSIFP